MSVRDRRGKREDGEEREGQVRGSIDEELRREMWVGGGNNE